MLQKLRLLPPAVLVLALTTALSTVFALGIGTGFFFYPRFVATVDLDDDHDHEIDVHEDDHDHEDHVALTHAAFDNLQLQLGPVTHGDFWKSILVPADIVEIPGRSDLSISAPVTTSVST